MFISRKVWMAIFCILALAYLACSFLYSGYYRTPAEALKSSAVAAYFPYDYLLEPAIDCGAGKKTVVGVFQGDRLITYWFKEKEIFGATGWKFTDDLDGRKLDPEEKEIFIQSINNAAHSLRLILVKSEMEPVGEGWVKLYPEVFIGTEDYILYAEDK